MHTVDPQAEQRRRRRTCPARAVDGSAAADAPAADDYDDDESEGLVALVTRVAASYAAGANAYHVKPVTFNDHLSKLRSLFDYWLTNAVLPPRSNIN